MLSICLPTYNYHIADIVADLSQQCLQCGIDFEIIVVEDGSAENFVKQNADIEQISGAVHIVNKQNRGRSATRNFLADKAKYHKLLFIDCDSAIPDSNFIQRYLDNYGHAVVCGGTTYNITQYKPEISLRYTFGTKVEKSTATKRNKQPYSAFTTNNLLIDKSIFSKIRFCEELKKYGHEDSLFGLTLKENNIPVVHIDNPVVHVGIEANNIFLDKTKAGIENLLVIRNIPNISKNFFLHIRLYRHYKKIESLQLCWLVRCIYKLSVSRLENSLLHSKHPSLFVFNFYKLGYLCTLAKKESNKLEPKSSSNTIDKSC